MDPDWLGQHGPSTGPGPSDPGETRPRRAWPRRALGLACLVLAWWAFRHRHAAVLPPGSARPQAQSLATGKEAKRKVTLVFVSEAKGTAEADEREIFETPSLVNQAKQAVLALMEGPRGPGMAKVFPAGSGLRELFLAKDGLCVVDFTPETAAAHPGGTTAEYQTLQSLVRTLTGNFPSISSVQVLLGGERRETFAGHFDILDPLTKDEF